MKIDSEADFLRKLNKIKSNDRYKYEIEPASYFVDYLEKEMGYTFTDEIDNKKDPPDFILKTDDKIINLEVTCLMDELIPKRNRFINKVERFINVFFEKYLTQNGKYEIFYIPGDIYTKIGNSMKITKPDYRNTISKSDLSELIENDIKTALENRSDVTKLEIKLHNRKNEIYGKIIINKISDNDSVKFVVTPQEIFRLQEWEERELQKSIQDKINEKEEKYMGKFDKEGEVWWLLISDPEDEMNTFDLKFNLNNVEFKSNFFKRVFFLSKYSPECKFYDLNITRYG